MTQRDVLGAGLLAVVLVFATAGCATSTGTPQVSATAAGTSSTSTAHAATKPSAHSPAEPVLAGVIATGAITADDGSPAGRLVLTAADNTVTATIEDFRTTATGQLDLQLTPQPVGAKCPADSWSFVMNQVDDEPHTWSLPIHVAGGPFEVDPRYLRSAVLRVDADGGQPGADGCAEAVLAVAPLTWNTASTHVGLVVTDHGARPHATGIVGREGAGTLSTYTVAPNDTVEAILARFHLTADDFNYLNPWDVGVEDSALRYGTVFNLLPANRGAPPN